MVLMEARRGLLAESWNSHGWEKQVFMASSDTTKGNTTIGAIQNYLPSNYRYAIALANTVSSPENNQFLGALFIPSRSEVLGLRYRDGMYNTHGNINSQDVDLILRSGQYVTIFWRTEEVGKGKPNTLWTYSAIDSPGITRINGLINELSPFGNWNAIITIQDIDYTTMPETNRTFCGGIFVYSNNPSGTWLRVNGDVYQSNTTVASTYECNIASGTKIVNFYI